MIMATTENPPVVKLGSGYDMPIVGLGTFSLHGEECVNAILSAIRLGYRRFDLREFLRKRGGGRKGDTSCDRGRLD